MLRVLHILTHYVLTHQCFEIGIIVVPHFTGEKIEAQRGQWLLFLQTRYTVLAQNMKHSKHVLNYSASSENEGYCISEFPGNSNTVLELWGGHLFSSYTILPS